VLAGGGLIPCPHQGELPARAGRRRDVEHLWRLIGDLPRTVVLQNYDLQTGHAPLRGGLGLERTLLQQLAGSEAPQAKILTKDEARRDVNIARPLRVGNAANARSRCGQLSTKWLR
jgi:hypothetical protein